LRSTQAEGASSIATRTRRRLLRFPDAELPAPGERQAAQAATAGTLLKTAS
jgi:hypothetical protein